LCRKVQSTTIRNGNELQHIIFNNIEIDKYLKISFGEMLILIEKGENFYCPNVKISKEIFNENGFELKGKKNTDVDGFLYLDGILYIIEYKDGDNLDTKKSQIEIESLTKLSNLLTNLGIDNQPKLVLWRNDDIENSSIKTTENREYLINGKNMSDLLDINFDEIVKIRAKEQVDNCKYFLKKVISLITIEDFNADLELVELFKEKQKLIQ
jgi:hypothetical protein